MKGILVFLWLILLHAFKWGWGGLHLIEYHCSKLGIAIWEASLTMSVTGIAMLESNYDFLTAKSLNQVQF